MTDKELVMKLEEDISWLEQGCTEEKEICEHIKQAIETIIHHKETANPWHTGTPTIEEIDKNNQYCYALCFYYDGWWLSDYLFKANHEEGCFENSPNNGQQVCKFKFSDDIAWQKIEPYTEASE